jgi:asparagine synthase (glutamine-hydrolysing)
VTESKYYQTNTLLRDSDANGMAHGLEIRVPFLDRRLVEWMNRLPGHERYPRGKPGKYLLRESVSDLLYPDLLARPKTGFTLPLRQWMAGPLRSMCEAGLNALKDTGLVKGSAVDALWARYLANADGHMTWTRAFTLVVLGDYLARHGR